MNSLATQITADGNSTTSLKTDIQSITGSYRIFALIIPQGAIEAATDRIMTIVSDMTTIGTKLQARIGSSASASVTSALADYNAKIADANTQAQAAASKISSLTPDRVIKPSRRRTRAL